MKVEQDNLILCLDFGTAMSKAWATVKGPNGEAKDLPVQLGTAAGEMSPLLLSSSVWIEDSGEILVGKRAVDRAMVPRKADRRRVDSLKQQLSQGNDTVLDGAELEGYFNPTAVKIHYGDLISFYLGYLTDLAEGELERMGHSRFVQRRFALPCWTPPRDQRGERLIREHLSRAQIIADTFHGRWNTGVTVQELRHVIDRLESLKTEWPGVLVTDGVLEPVAAGASRLENAGGEGRRLVMVVDVGAGTTDFALFIARETAEGEIKFFPLTGCTDAIRQAGDEIDEKLRRLILRQASVDEGSAQYSLVNSGLLQAIRTHKETLFREKRLRYLLSNDAGGEVNLETLLAEPGVKEFSDKLEEKFQAVLVRAKEAVKGAQYDTLEVLLTGGGAELPMVKALATGQISCGGITLRREAVPALPPSWQDRAADVKQLYPQLAVAIGGAQPELAAVGRATMPKGPTLTVSRVPGFGG